MKVTKTRLQQIIQEETQKLLEIHDRPAPTAETSTKPGTEGHTRT